MKITVFKKFSKYVSLNILGMIGISLYILADTFFISIALGSLGIASLNLSISIYSIIHGVGLMIGIGGATRFSILRAQNENVKSSIVFTHAIKLGVFLGLVFLIIGVIGSKYLALGLGADLNTLPLSQKYLLTILVFSPFFILNNILLAFVRNDHEPKLAMTAMLLGSFVNIILDYVFMFPLNMGMFGAALATGVAPILSILILSIHFLKKNNNLMFVKSRLKLIILKDICALGLSSFIIEASSAVALITLNLVILDIKGNLGVAAYGIIANLALVIIAIFTGIAQGSQPLISKYHGLKDFKKVELVKKYAVYTAFILSIVVYCSTFIYSKSIIHIFNSEQNEIVANIANIGLKIYFIGFIFVGLNITLTMYLSATENIREALIISLLRGLIIIVPMVIVLSQLFDMVGIWIAFVATELIVSILGLCFTSVKNKMLGIDI